MHQLVHRMHQPKCSNDDNASNTSSRDLRGWHAAGHWPKPTPRWSGRKFKSGAATAFICCSSCGDSRDLAEQFAGPLLALFTDIRGLDAACLAGSIWGRYQKDPQAYGILSGLGKGHANQGRERIRIVSAALRQ